MTSDWREVALEAVAADITVGHVGPMVSEYVADGIPFLRSQNVEPLRINDTDIKFITPSFHERLKKSALSPGDVVIVRTGKPGACAVIPKTIPVANCSDLVIVRCSSQLDPTFLSYYVNSAAAHHVDSHLVGAVQQHFNVGAARKMVLRLPPMREQQAIAHILGTLDDKTHLNRRQNETLEAMARALFKSWFVNFDPVHAKARQRPSGLTKQVEDLFPTSFENSQRGEIPLGWGVKSIGELAEVLGGSTPSTKEPSYWEGGTHFWATPKDLSGLASPILLGSERKVTSAGLAQISSGLLPKGTILLSSRAPIGYLAITEVPVAINQGFIAMVPKPGISNIFLLIWAGLFHDEIVSRANGSTFLEISKSSFRSIPVVTPPPKLMSEFDRHVQAMYRQIAANEHENQTLVNTRNLLLPRLLSGELTTKGIRSVACGGD